MTLLGLLYAIAFMSPIVMSLKACVNQAWWVWVIGALVGIGVGTLNVVIWRKSFLVFERKSLSCADADAKSNSVISNIMILCMIAWIISSVIISSGIMQNFSGK